MDRLYTARAMGTDGVRVGGRRSAQWHRNAMWCALAIAVAVAAGCGSSSTSTPATPSTGDNLLSAQEISKQPSGSVQKSFLGYWSSLQYRSWADAAAYYDPVFRDFVGTVSLIGAKKVSSSIYPLVKPKIERLGSDGPNTTIFYTLVLPDGTKELNSTTWRRNGGNWQIIYDSRLDAELGQLATNQAEVKQSGALPSGTGPASPEAVRAGKAAEQEQARFLEEELNTSAP